MEAAASREGTVPAGAFQPTAPRCVKLRVAYTQSGSSLQGRRLFLLLLLLAGTGWAWRGWLVPAKIITAEAASATNHSTPANGTGAAAAAGLREGLEGLDFLQYGGLAVPIMIALALTFSKSHRAHPDGLTGGAMVCCAAAIGTFAAAKLAAASPAEADFAQLWAWLLLLYVLYAGGQRAGRPVLVTAMLCVCASLGIAVAAGVGGGLRWGLVVLAAPSALLVGGQQAYSLEWSRRAVFLWEQNSDRLLTGAAVTKPGIHCCTSISVALATKQCPCSKVERKTPN